MSDTTVPSTEQEQRAKWDLLLADIEYRQEQLRQARQQIGFLPWQVAFAGMTSGAAFLAAGFALGKLFAWAG